MNPVGRIVSRFSKDISVLDMVLPYIAERFLILAFRITSVFLVAIVLLPWLAVPIILSVIGVVILRKKVLSVMVETMKLETLSRSPIVSMLGSTVRGLVSIRAYDRTRFFTN